MATRKKTRSASAGAQIPAAERAVAIVGALLLAAVIAFLVHAGMRAPSPPEIRVEVVAIHAREAGHLVVFRARNLGRSHATAVTIEGELRSGDGTVAGPPSQATLSFLPGGSTRQGGLFFAPDPRRYEIFLRAVGYQEP